MNDNFDKLWLQDSLNRATLARIEEAMSSLGMALPCHVVSVSGAIVTVAFDVISSTLTLPQISIPKAESPWIRMPTQAGDKGFTVPASVSLGGISGLGAGLPSLSEPGGNLTALVFVPVSSQNAPPSNQNAAIMQGPDGAIIQTTSGTTSQVQLDTSSITVTFGSSTITVNGSEITLTAGGKTVTLNSTGFTIDGILFDTHVHGGVSSGSSLTLGPQA